MDRKNLRAASKMLHINSILLSTKHDVSPRPMQHMKVEQEQASSKMNIQRKQIKKHNTKATLKLHNTIASIRDFNKSSRQEHCFTLF